MKWIFFVLVCALHGIVGAQEKTVHVFVALCDNKNQGILPVPESIGNGQDPRNNLYWGALYGVKTYFRKSDDWDLIKSLEASEPHILERLIFKHRTKNVYLLADAYDGAHIKETVSDFMDASSGNFEVSIQLDSKNISFGGKSDVLTYIGHNGLMDFYMDKQYKSHSSKKRETIILACISKNYFTDRIRDAGATPLLWTTGYMAPEAYTLEWALDAWVEGKPNTEVRQKAAEAYNHYQKCGIRGAKGLLVSGF